MKNITHIIRTVLVYSIIFLASSIYAQKSDIKKANKKFEDLAYIDALKIYESVANEGFEDVDLYRKIANANYFNANYDKAAKWYKALFELEPEQAPECAFKYGQSLKSIGDYKNSDIYLKQFFQTQNYNYISSEQYLKDISKKSNRYTIEKSDFNSNFSDYSGYLNENKLYVVTANSKGKKTPWNNEPSSDIFVLEGNKLKLLKGDVNTKYNEGSLVITKDGNTMYFTRNDYTNKKLGKDSNATTRLKLYKATKEDGEWGNVEELPFNSSEYSVGHPALSKDESKLYFVSDKLGGKGGTDLYEVEILADGSFEFPENMATFNTLGNEMFPFVDPEGTFYFSSNGHPNLGGLDVFFSKEKEQGVYETIYNVGKPVNSTYDDFAFMIANQNGYFASNRQGAKSDDIYEFEELEPFEEPCFMLVEGVVKDRKTGDIIPNATVSLLDGNNSVVDKMVANDNAKYTFADVDCKKVKFVRAEDKNYFTNEELIAAGADDNHKYNEILLVQRQIPITAGTDLALLLNPIYFDLDESYIRPDAKIELEKIIAILNEYPAIEIDVRSHTDSRANDNYNIALSERRAQSTIDYLLKRGIGTSRLTGRGYGETQLTNRCSNDVDCSEEEHQMNRRSEFIIK